MNYSVSNTKEIALEQAIERRLCGATTEELVVGDGPLGPFRIGLPSDFDPSLALDKSKFWEFLETTQSKDLEKLKQHNP
ncbi:hypothetical protein, partial [Maritalea sp.]|uniref:hypothetical protein n=1 Tax=Maritalea sp. TaxID=2003361 RepID=UPI003EF2D56B